MTKESKMAAAVKAAWDSMCSSGRGLKWPEYPAQSGGFALTTAQDKAE